MKFKTTETFTKKQKKNRNPKNKDSLENIILIN